jgi:hypothetical protein
MRRAAVILALAAGLPAQAASLSPAGADLGRLNAADITGALTVTVELEGDRPAASHVIARFQNNQPLSLGRDGLWAPWDGSPATLDEAGAETANGVMTFRLMERVPADLFYPVAFTLIYDTPAGRKSGTLVLDGP